MGAAALSRILSQLRGCTQPKPNQWQACCPVHKGGAEENQSFGVQILPDGRIRMNCFCGCDPDAVERALSVTWADLAPDSGLAYTPGAGPEPAPSDEWAARCAEWELGFTTDRRAALADALWLPPAAFDQFAGLGFRTDHREGPCWTFPERDAAGRVIGVGLRFTDHRKKVAEGGRRGLSVPLGWKERPGAVYTVEGPSDTLAMTAAGLACVGRPSNVGGVKLLAELVRAEVPADRPVVWMGENDRDPVSGDWPGRDASKKAAAKLAAELPDHKVSFALPPGEDKDVRKWLARLHMDGCTWGECGKRFVKFAKPQPVRAPAAPAAPAASTPEAGEDHRCVIHHPPGADEFLTNNKVVAVLANGVELFARSDALVTVVCATAETVHKCKFPPGPKIAPLEAFTLREMVSHRVRFTTNPKKRGGEPEDKDTPEWCVGAIMNRKQWDGIRYLEAIVEYPFLRPDGSLVTEPGFDPQTGAYLYQHATRPALPDVIDRAAALDAWAQLEEVIADFPFQQPYHKSAWLCGLLTPLARFAFDGPAPLFMVDGNTPGAGKGLLCNVASIILTGQDFPTVPYSHEDEEMRKKITAFAGRGAKGVLFDNVSGRFGGSVIDALLTSTIWEDRILGSSTIVTFPLRATWWATANNVQIAGDGLRRIVVIRLETKDANPEERTGFVHARLKQWVRENRARLLGCALTILMAYCRAGRPAQKIAQWGSYEDWSDLVRSAVAWLGLADPADGKKELRRASDPVMAAMTTILTQWERLDTTPNGITTNAIISKVFPARPSETPEPLQDIAEAISAMCAKNTGQQLAARFRSFHGRTVEGRRLDRVGENRNVIRWGVYDAKTGKIITRSEDGEDGEDVSRPDSWDAIE